MEKIYSLTLAALLSATALTANAAEENDLKVATLEDVELAADSHMPQTTAEFDEEIGFQSGDFWFDMYTYSDWATWWGYGVANHTSTAYASLNDQYNCIAGAGVDASANYGVAFISDYMGPTFVTLTTDEAATVPGVYVTNAAYAYTSMANGDSYAKKFAKGDWFKLTVTGYDDAEEVVGTKDFYLADLRSEDESEWYIIKDWYYVDLSTLGAVRQLKFTLSSTDTGQWGMNTPAYFCYDNLGATGTEVVPEGNLGGIPTGISTSAQNAAPAVRYDVMGRQNANVRGIQLVRMSDGTVRKVVK